jgi:hypothetical protein
MQVVTRKKVTMGRRERRRERLGEPRKWMPSRVDRN